MAETCRRESLEALQPKALRAQHLAVLRALHDIGPLTDEELQKATNLSPNAERPRRGELVALGFVEESGGTRKTNSGRNATVWRLSAAGRARVAP